jgi:hypothetical protein
MVYTAYGSVIKYIQIIDVSSVETIEIEHKDADLENIEGIYSVKFGRRKYIGDEIRWDEEGCDNFKIYDNGRNIHNDSDTEEDSDEEEEEEEEVESLEEYLSKSKKDI